MKFKKAYLYSAIALLLVATSLFFTIYGNNGKAYNYAKQDLSKYVSGLVYENIDISGVKLSEVTEIDVHAKIAALLKAAATKNNSNKLPSVSTGKNTINMYDIAVLNYYGVIVEDGVETIITVGSLMNPNSGVDFQIGATAEANLLFKDKDLNQKFSDSLINKISGMDFSYNTITSGYLHANDIIYISYTADGAEKETANVRVDLSKGEAAINQEYGEGFYAKLLETPITKKLTSTTTSELKFGEKKYSTLAINWAARTTLLTNSVAGFVEGDVVYATVDRKDANGTISYVIRMTVGANQAVVAYDAYNLTKGEKYTGDNNQAKLEDAVLNAIAKSVLNGTGQITHEATEVVGGQWEAGKEYYVHVEDQYVEVTDKTAAPKSDVQYYTYDYVKTAKPLTAFSANKTYYTLNDGTYTAVEAGTTPNAETQYYTKEYVKTAKPLSSWADGTTYYTFSAAHYEKVDTTVVTAPVEGTTYYSSLGAEFKYNVTSVVRETLRDGDKVKDAEAPIEITFEYPADSTEKSADGKIELNGKTVIYRVFVTGVRDIATTYTNISAISGGFDSHDASRLKAIKSALDSYNSTLSSMKTLFKKEDLVNTYVDALKAYRADASDANKAPYEAAYNALVAEALKDSKGADVTEASKKENLKKFEDAYDAMLRTMAVYYGDVIAEGIVEADKAHTEALEALKAFFGEANVETVNAYIDALKAYKADADNNDKKAAWEAAKAALIAVALESDEEAKTQKVTTYEAEYAAYLETVLRSYNDLEQGVAVSKAIIAAKEALEAAFVKEGDTEAEDIVHAYFDAWLAYKASSTDANKTSYENALNAMVALEVEGKDEAAKKALATAYETAYGNLEAAVKKHAVAVVTAWLDEEAYDVLLADAEDDLTTEYKNNYINEVAKLLWETILNNTKVVKYPSKAVRLAVEDQMDSYKQTYYTTKTEYEKYKSFKDYLKNGAFKDVDDYEAAIEEDAKEMVKEHMVVFHLADMLEIDVSEKAITEDYNYASMYVSYPEQTQTAFAFDQIMIKLMDEVYASKMATPRK